MTRIRGDLYDLCEVEERLPEIEDMYRNKATHKMVAGVLGVSERTVIRWLNAGQPGRNGERNPVYNPKYKAFYNAYLKGKRRNIQLLKSTAYDVALGGLVKKTIKKTKNPDGSICETEIEETLPPNTSTLHFLLKSLCPEEFGDKQEIKHSGTIGTPLSGVDDGTLEQLKKIAKYQNSILNVDGSDGE